VSGTFENDRLVAPDEATKSKAGEPPHLAIDVREFVEGALELAMDPDDFLEEPRLLKEIRDVLHVFLRNNVDLKKIYRHYSMLGLTDVSEGDNGFHLSLSQLWQLFKDCELSSPSHTLATVNEELLAAWRKSHMPPPLHIVDVDDPHAGSRRVIFREFAEAIVRAACAMYGRREKQIGVSGAHPLGLPLGLFLNPLGLFLRTSVPFVWRILSAFLPA
jgi:hypothetical protein